MTMKVLYVVNVADAQSIPLELGLRIQEATSGVILAGYYGCSDHPTDHESDRVINLGARKALDVAAIGRLRATIQRVRPDIIHMHHTVSAFWCVLIGLMQRSPPILVKTEHNDHRFLPRHQSALNMLIYPWLQRIVCNSDSTLASFNWIERQLAGSRGQRIYNGVDMARIHSRAANGDQARTALRPHIPPGAVLIGKVGRLVPQKNHLRLLEGLAEARQQSGRDIRLVLVGGGALQTRLEEKCEELSLDGAVIFAGAMAREQVYDLLHGLDGVIMASNWEGFCNALVEGMAAGRPAACADIATLREVAGDHAIRFDQNDTMAIACALATLSERQPISEPDSKADAARTFVHETYDIVHAVRAHVALYEKLLDSKTARG